MSTPDPVVYSSDYGDYYLPVEHFPTYELALDEVMDYTGAEEDELSYDGVQSTALHTHSMTYDDECTSDDPEDPCLGWFKCHAFRT